MKPLPAQLAAGGKTSGETIPSLPSSLSSGPSQFSKTNRRATTSPSQRAYPWLLSASTALAATFCLLYITKPVINPTPPAVQLTTPAVPQPVAPTQASSAPARSGLMPSSDRLPGESAANGKPLPADPRRVLPGPPSSSAFEETNLRIQHILTAEAPGGHLDRIDIDVPVLYQSRHLRWTATEVAEARTLLVQLMDYQEKSQALRAEGMQLLDAWNHLIGNSIPATDLRADSPSLPANQQDAADAPRPAGSMTTESIQLQPSGK